MNMTGQLSDREEASRSFFNKWAAGYESRRISPWFQHTQMLAIGHLDLQPDSRVLDVGCGTGWATRAVAASLPAGRACGIDISPDMIGAARRATPNELKDRVEFQEGSAQELPYGDNEFSHALCTNSFHHYPDPQEALREIRRVLRTGGQLVILENAPDLSWYAWMWDKILRVFESGHVRYYPSQELGALIRDSGFANVELLVLRNEFMKHGKLFASIQLWRGEK